MTDNLEELEREPCRNCNGSGWVCENHRDRPWFGLAGDEECCGGAGAPCGACNLEMASAGYVDRALIATAHEVEGLRERNDALALQADEWEGKYATVSEINERLREVLELIRDPDNVYYAGEMRAFARAALGEKQ